MKLNNVFLVWVISVLMITNSCKKSDSNSSSNNNVSVFGIKITTNVAGKVIDQVGNALSGVAITIGSVSVNTDASGSFMLPNVSIYQHAGFVKASRIGYFTSGKTIYANENVVNNVLIQLVQSSASASFTNSAGGTVAITGGMAIKFTGNSVLTSSGAAYMGSVNVSAYYLDPTATDANNRIPGALRGIDSTSNENQLISYGMMVANLTDNMGNPLLLDSTKNAEITFPIPSSQLITAPSTISLWYFDEITGVWMEKGIATKVGNNYVGNVNHFSWWNCDMGGGPIEYKLRFVDSSGQPISNQHVTFVPNDGTAGGGHGMTTSDGTITSCVPPNKLIKVTMDMTSGTCRSIVYNGTVGPFTASSDGGNVTVTLATLGLVSCTISGSAVDCNNNKISNGYANINIDGSSYYSLLNNGNFSLTFVRCSNAAAIASILVTNNTTQTQNTQPVTFLVTKGNSTPVSITACGLSTVEFINFSIAGTKYVCDTGFNAFFEQNMIMISGNSKDNSTNVWCNIMGTTTGTFPVMGFQMSANNKAYNVNSMTSTITEFGLTGQFFAGTLTGTIKDSANVVSNITGSYRIKRRQ